MKQRKTTLSIAVFLITLIIIVSKATSQVFANEGTLNEKVKITMSFAGDCTLGSDLKYGMAGSFVQLYDNLSDPSYFFSAVVPIFEQDDLTIVNLEGPLTNSGQKADKQFAFKGIPEYTNILTNGSVEIVNIANNHSYDYGVKGFNETISNLDNAQIGSFGYDKKYITERNGIKAGFLGYTALSYNKSLENQIKSDILALKDQGANVVVVSMHSGIEANNYPNDIQKKLAKYAIDNGADLVVGHHPHVVQGIEEYKGKYIVYSLANFCFGGNKNPKDKDTFIFRQAFEFDKATMEITDSIATIYPCSISSVTTKNDFKPTPLLGDEAIRVMNRLIEYSSSLNNNIDIVTAMYHENQPIEAPKEIDPSGFEVASPLTLMLFGEEISFEKPLLTKNNFTYVPAIEFFEKSGAEFEFDSNENTLTIINGNDKSIFWIDGDVYEIWSSEYEDDDENSFILSSVSNVSSDFSPTIYQEEIYIPIRSAVQALGYFIEWDNSAKCIVIK